MNDEIFFDGVRYIAAGDAASNSGLTRDYIARLCRDEKVRGRRVGKNWYVDSDSFRSFLITQEYAKSRRGDELAKERSREYKAASTRSLEQKPSNTAGQVAAPGAALVSQALAERTGDIRSKLQAALDTSSHLPSGFASAALQAAHIPVYTLTPLVEFLHKLVALTLTFAFVFGTYAAVDPQYAHYAVESTREQIASAIDSYRSVTGGGVEALAARTQSQVAAVAEDPQLARSAIAGLFSHWLPATTAQIARALNTRVNDLVYAIAFPADLIRSLGIPGQNKNGTVTVAVLPYHPTTPIAPTNAGSSPALAYASSPRTVINQPVIERVVETQRIVTAGGITQSQLDERLNELNDKLTSQIFAITSSGSTLPSSGGYTNNIALTQRIDELDGTDIRNATITGGSITGVALSASDLSGTVAVVNGGTGTSSAPTYGQLLVGNSSGSYDLVATSSLGITGSGGTGVPGGSDTQVQFNDNGAFDGDSSFTFSTSSKQLGATGAIFVNATTTNSTSTNLYSSSLIADNATSTNFFAVLGNFTTGIFNTISSAVATITSLTATNLVATNATTTNATTTNLALTGVGANMLLSTNATGGVVATSTPTASYFIATSTTATSTFAGNLSVAGNINFNGAILQNNLPFISSQWTTSGANISYTAGNVGIGTTTPGARLSVEGSSLLGNSATAGYFVATTSTNNVFPNLVATNATTTNATSTNFFATTASSTNLFSQSASLGALAAGSLSLSSFTGPLQAINGSISATSTLSVGYGGTGSTTLSGLLKGNGTGALLSAVAGTDYENPLTFSTGLSRVGNAITNTGVLSVFGRAGAVVAQSGDYNTSQVTESGNLYYTDARVNSFIASSSTVPKTYTDNVFTGGNIFGNSTTTNATSTNFFSTTASSTNLFAQTAQLGSLTLVSALSIASGGTNATSFTTGAPLSYNGTRFVSTSTLSVAYGGTGFSSYTPGDLLYADSSGNLAKLPLGGNGTVLKVSGGFPAWGTDLTGGGGSGSGFFATTSDSLAIHPTDTSYVTLLGTTATSTSGNILEILGNSLLRGNLNVTGNTTLTNATTTNLFSTTASSTNLFAQTASLGTLNLVNALSVVNGGTGATSFTSGQLLSYNGTSFVSTSTIGNNQLANASVTFNGTSGLSGGGTVALGGTANITLDLTHANSWTGLQVFANASSTLTTLATTWFSGNAGTLLSTDGSGKLQNTNVSYPLQFSGSTLSSAFGTTTANMFSQLQTFSGGLTATNATATTIFSSAYHGNTLAIGGTSTTSIDSAGNLLVQGGTGAGDSLDVNGTTNALYYNVAGSQFIDNNKDANIHSVSINGGLGVIDSAGVFTSNAGAASTFPYASSTALTVSGNSYLGAAQASSLSLTAALSVGNGGTGSTTLSGLLKGNGTGAIQTAVGGTDYENPLSFSTGLNRSGNTITNTGVLAIGPTGQTSNGTVALATSTAGTDFTITGSGSTLTFNLPSASASARGVLSSSDWTTFNSKVSASRTLIAGAGLTGGGDLSADRTFAIDFTRANSWTGLQQFGNASSTQLSVTNKAYFGATATTTIDSNGNVAVAGTLGVTGNTTLAQATSSALAITSITNKLLKTDGSGNVVPAVAGTDYQAAGTYLTALGTGYATTTANSVALSTTTQSFNGLTIAQSITASAGALTFTPNFSGTLDNSGLTHSTISGIALGANLANLTATNGTLTFSSAYNGGTAQTVGLNLGNANSWTGLQTFANASSTLATLATTWFSGNTGTLLSTDASGKLQNTTVSSPLSFSGSTLSIPQANGSTNGFLAAADFTTFNGKQSTISATWPITLTGATVGFNGLSTSSAAVVGNIPYFSGVNTFANVSTSSLSASAEFAYSGVFGSLVGGTNGTLSLSTNGTAYSKLVQAGANTILGNPTGATGNVQAFATSSLGVALTDTTGTLGVARGGTGATSLNAGEVLVGNGTGAVTSTTTANLKTSLALNNVENTALSTWAGSGNITTVGTVTSGTWSGLFGAITGANLTHLTAANIDAGTAGISVTGNAGTATALQNARTINNVSFNGTGNITITAASSTLLSDNNTFSGNTILANATTTNLFSTTASSTNLFSQTASIGSLTLLSALPIASGGTNATSFTSGKPLAFDGTRFVSTSTLGVNVGGTGATSLTGILKGNGTGAFTALTGTDNYLPKWSSNSLTGTSLLYDNGIGELRIGTTTNYSGNSSRLFVWGGASGANIDVMGDPSVTGGDQATLELESSDYYRNQSSIYMQYVNHGLGSNMGFANTHLAQLVFNNASTSLIYTNSATPLIFGTNLFERMRLDASGNLGIGTTTPFAKLSLAAASLATTPLLSISTSTASATTTVFAIDQNGNTTIGNNGSVLTINGATTTAAKGINLTAGCFAMGGNCLTLGSFSGTLAIANGGTNAASFTSGQLLSYNGTSFVSTSTIGNNQLANSTIALTSSGSITVGSSPISLGGTGTLNLNLGNANSWTGLQTFANASSTLTTLATTWFSGNTGTLLSSDASGKLQNTSVSSPLSFSGSTLSIGTVGIANGGTGATTQVTAGVNYFDGTKITSGTALIFDGTHLGIGTTTAAQLLTLSAADAGTSLTSAGLASLSIINSDTTANNTADLVFKTADTAGTTVVGTKFAAVFTSHAPGAVSADLALLTRNAGTLSEKLRLTAAGNLGLGTTSPFAKFSLAASSLGTFPLLSISTSTASATTTVFAIDQNGNTTIGNNGSALTINGATTTAVSGINLTTGCFAIGGNCLTLGSFSGTLAIANGGTNATSFSAGQPLAFDGTRFVSTSTLSAVYGGTGVNNGAKTITLGGNISTANTFTTAGNFALTLTQTGTTNVTLPVTTTDTLVGKATTDIFTNKTFDTGGTGNVFKIAGTQYTGVTGTGGTLVASANPTFTGLANFANASTTLFSSLGPAYFGTSATSSFSTAGVLTLASALTVPNGGTGAGTLTGLLQGNGTSPFTAVTGTAGQFPYYNGINTALATSSIFLTTAGNIGIGTTTPWANSTGGAALLDLTAPGPARFVLHNTIAGQEAKISLNNGVDFNVSGAPAAVNNVMTFATEESNAQSSPTERMRIDSTGNVGIGTVLPLNKLSVTGASVAGDTSGIGTLGIFSITTGTGASTDNKLEFGVHDSDYSWIQALQAGTAFRNLLLNPGGGNVGIGTTTPLNALTLERDQNAPTRFDIVNYSSGSSAFAGIGLNNDTGVGGAILQNGSNNTSTYGGANSFNLINVKAAPLTLGTSNLVRMTVDTSGNVGIGTTTPWGRLAVSTPAQQDGTIPLFNVASTTNASIFTVFGNGSTNIGGNLTVRGTGTSTFAGDINQLGKWETLEQELDMRISDDRRNSYFLSDSLGITYHDDNKQTVTLATGEDLIHGLIYARGYLWATTVTSPAKLIRFNPDNLNDYTVITFPADGHHIFGLDLTYVKSKDRLYVAMNDTTRITVSEVNPTTMAFTDVISDSTFPSSVVPGGPSITHDDNFLYVITSETSSHVVKYSLSNFALVGSATLTGLGDGHALRYDGTNLYATGDSSPGWVARINPSTMTVSSSQTFATGDNMATDDFAEAGDYLYVGLEATSGSILRIKKSDLTQIDHINTGVAAQVFDVFFDGKYVMVALNTTPGTWVRIDPQTLETRQATFATGEDTPNEIVTDGQRYFVTYYLTPAKVARITLPSFVGGVYAVANTTNSRTLVLDGSGNFGLGTTTPWGKLAISTAAQQDGTIPLFNIASTTNASIFNVLGNGNVGIGTTTPWARLSIDTTGLGANVPEFAIGSSTRTDLVVNQGGFVGLGTLAPLNKLSVTGASVAADTGAGTLGQFSITSGTGATTDNKLEFGVHDGDYSWIQALQAGTGFRNLSLNPGGGSVGVGTTTPWARFSIDTTGLGAGVPEFAVGSSIRTDFVVTQAGNVGIGVTNPVTKLHIVGASAAPVGGGTDGILQIAAGPLNGDAKLQFGVSDAGLYGWIASVKTSVGLRNLVLNPSGGNVGIGTTTPGATFAVAGAGCFAKTANGIGCNTATVAGDIYYNTAHAAGGFDVAETYQISGPDPIGPGTIVGLDQATGMTVLVATSTDNLFGIVSSQPALLFGDYSASMNGFASVALAGRVPVRVSLEDGPIAVGDRITLSSIPGIGMKATSSVRTLGVALENYSSPTATGTIMVLVQPEFTFAQNHVQALGMYEGFSGGLQQAMAPIRDGLVKLLGDMVAATTGIFNKVFAKEVHTDKLCVSDTSGETCITKSQLDALIAGAAASQNGGGGGNGGGSSNSGSTGSPQATPPVISVNGSNPATVNIGDTYSDLGATITGPQADLNLGISVSVDGAATTTQNQIQIDTTTAGTHTIIYSVTDQSGLTGSATRTVTVVDPNAGSGDASSTTP